eukprot:9519703-Lingulodinium_polyedra.AAC.1
MQVYGEKFAGFYLGQRLLAGRPVFCARRRVLAGRDSVRPRLCPVRAGFRTKGAKLRKDGVEAI